MRALRVDQRVFDWLKNGAGGQVQSTFSRSCNIRWGENLIPLLHPELGMAPGGVILHPPADGDWRLQPGDPVSWDRSGQRLVTPRRSISLSGARCWRNGPPLSAVQMTDRAAEEAWALVEREGRGTMAQAIRAPIGETEPLTNFGPLALDLGREVVQRLGEGGDAVALLPRLVGLGEGLTPSGDDLLIGLLAVTHFGSVALDQGLVSRVQLLATAIAARAPRATTAVSAHYLRQAAQGAFSERAEAAATALLSGLSSPDPLTQLLTSGHSSGTDTLIGMVFGLKLFSK